MKKKLLTAIVAFGLFSTLAPSALAQTSSGATEETAPVIRDGCFTCYSASEVLQAFDDLYRKGTYDKINTDLEEARKMAKEWDQDAGLVKFVAYIGLKGDGYWFTFASKNKPGKILEIVPTLTGTLVQSEPDSDVTYDLKDIEYVPLKMRDMVDVLLTRGPLLKILDLKIDNNRDVGMMITLKRNANGYLRWLVDFRSSKETDLPYPSQDYQVRTSAETTQSPYFNLYRLP